LLAAAVVGLLVGPVMRALLWAPAFLLMGAACVYNAAHCGRLHCRVTGPLYLLAAVATVLLALGAVPIEWSWIAMGVVVGTVLGYVPEWVRGKYAS